MVGVLLGSRRTDFLRQLGLYSGHPTAECDLHLLCFGPLRRRWEFHRSLSDQFGGSKAPSEVSIRMVGESVSPKLLRASSGSDPTGWLVRFWTSLRVEVAIPCVTACWALICCELRIETNALVFINSERTSGVIFPSRDATCCSPCGLTRAV